MKKVVFFAQDGIGGAERVMVTLANLLANSNYDVRFVLINNPNSNSKSLSTLIEGKFEFKRIFWRGQIQFLKALYYSIKEFSPELIFSSAMHINQRLLLFKPLFKNVKFIVRNDNYLYTIPGFKRATLKYTYRLADAIIGQTEEMGIELRYLGLSPQKIHVVRNPVDTGMIDSKLKSESPFDKDDKSIKFIGCGRFSYQKGFDILVKAFVSVKNRIPNSKLFLLGNTDYGDGEVYTKVKDIIVKNNMEKDVVCTGHVDNPFIYIKYADVFVLSSRWEGLPNVLLESEYIGTPSASVKCIPVIERMVREGESGYLAEPENPESLAEAMVKASRLSHFKYEGSEKNNLEWIELFNKIAR